MIDIILKMILGSVLLVIITFPSLTTSVAWRTSNRQTERETESETSSQEDSHSTVTAPALSSPSREPPALHVTTSTPSAPGYGPGLQRAVAGDFLYRESSAISFRKTTSTR